MTTLKQELGTTRKFILKLMRYWNVDESPAAPDNALNELRREERLPVSALQILNAHHNFGF